jgi:NADH dehydrogenase FAD-containing subunit
MLALRHLRGATVGRFLSTEAAETYDVVVVGGGMVGMSLAAALGVPQSWKLVITALWITSICPKLQD